MFRHRRLVIFAVAVNVIIFYVWRLLFGENVWIGALGINGLQTIGLTFCIISLHRAMKKSTNKQRRFWLLIYIGILFYFLANIVLFYFLIQDNSILLSNLAYWLWLVSYVFFLTSLIYWIRWENPTNFNRVYFFNIIVFMVTLTAIKIHYLIEPILTFSENSLLVTGVTLAFLILNLSIKFVIIILFYLIHKSKKKFVMLLIILGFFLQIIADSYFAYLNVMNMYYPGNLADLLWLISIWLIGFAGFYVKGDRKEPILKTKEPFEKKEALIPYISTVVLIILVIQSYQENLNALSIGLTVTVSMIIVRQFYIMKENNNLIEEYRYLAYHDALTELKNRVSFEEQLDHDMKNNKDSSVALILIDLDRFKMVNDTLGHQAGDYILIKISDYLKQTLEINTQVFRLGGDEFAIILPNATENKCRITAETLLNKFKKPFTINDYEIIVTASIGISIFPKHGVTYDELFKYADAAMYLAKEGGKNGYRFYDDELNQVMARRMRIESDLRKAIEKNQLEAFYQPKVELHTKKVIGMEALLRWNHPELGWISPAEIIPVAEETGQIVAIGEWILGTACKQNKKWQDKGFPRVSVSVNVSVRQFQHGDFLAIVKKALEDSQLEPRFLELEVTESIMQNTEESSAVLYSLRKMGIKISIDDFGTGYSSLHMIQHLPIDTIKLDKSFIDNIGDRNQQAMVNTIISLGINLKLNVVAEGIETEYQLKKLIESNCHIGQGYLFSKPVTPEEFEDILRENDFSEVQPVMMP